MNNNKLMLLTRLEVRSFCPKLECCKNFWMIRPTTVSDDSWFSKCAGVHKPLHITTSTLLGYYLKDSLYLQDHMFIVKPKYAGLKGRDKMDPCTITFPATLKMENVDIGGGIYTANNDAKYKQ